MMNMLYEIFPIFLFFMAFKFYGIYVATVVGIVATFLQMMANRFWLGKWDNKQIITFFVFVFFGGMTLYFHNPIFVKWKPTIVFWIFGIIILGSQFFSRKPLMQRFLENAFQQNHTMVLPQIWKKLNLMWAIFFVVLGGLNLYVAYYLSDNAWVNFKFYGITGLLFLFSILQAVYLMRYMAEIKSER